MRIITAGSVYIDVDAYAGCIAYAELLQKQGIEARAVSTAPLNESINVTIRSWQAPLYTNYIPSKDDTYTLIDLSDPDYFDEIVDQNRVDEVIDHHPGLEQYWQERLGDGAHIEFIGAACTMVYERWKAAKLLDEMSILSARLLICGILDNTLNFGAKVTTKRDVEAYNALISRADLLDDWTSRYFMECQDAILDNVAVAIKNDTKILTFKTFDRPVCFGQLVVWDAKQALAEQQGVIREVLASIKSDWFMNLISVGERKSYFITDNTDVQAWLTDLLGVQFDNSIAVADRLWLRKEVIKQDIITHNPS